MKLDPIVLDKAKEITGARSDNHLGVTFLNRTGTTVKNWRSGKTLPDVLTLYELHALTGETVCAHHMSMAANVRIIVAIEIYSDDRACFFSVAYLDADM